MAHSPTDVRWKRVTLLPSSSGSVNAFQRGLRGHLSGHVQDLAGDATAQAPVELAFAQAFGGAFDVVASGLVMAHPDNGDDVERAVACSVTAVAEPMSAGGQATAGRLGRDSADLGERGLASDPVGVWRRR